MTLCRSQALVLTGFASCVVLSFLWPSILPGKYFYDSDYLRLLIESTPRIGSLGDSFANTAAVYWLLGAEHFLPQRAAIILGLASCFFLLGLCLRTVACGMRWVPGVFIAAWSVIASIYLGQYSKEVVSFLVTAGAFLLWRPGRRALPAVALIATYAVFFRNYWAMILAIALSLHYIWSVRKVLSFRWTLLLGAVLLVAFFNGYHQVTGSYVTQARTDLNQYRDPEDDASSMITNPFSNTSVLTDVGNAAYGTAVIVAPVGYLLTGNTRQRVASLFQLLFSFTFLRSAIYLLRRPDRFNVRWSPRTMNALNFGVFWVLAFWMVQGSFEPDLGSFLKHEIAFLPFALPVILACDVVREHGRRFRDV